ncbi:MAG: hypothetical protein GXY34_14290 [Syntrophomonadaceae bacterium]|nr:hypothetical protein [Syntrophomonadaceae bacterium]
MNDILKIRYDGAEVSEKRRQIREAVIQRSANVKSFDIKKISGEDLELLYELYDSLFFQDWFRNNYRGTLEFSFSRRMTKSAGITSFPRNIDPSRPSNVVVKVKISTDFILRYGSAEGERSVAGIGTESSLEALQLIFEHEMVHVIEFIHFQRSSCKGKRFKTIASNLFSHTESYHRLPTNQEIARQQLGIIPGDRISFRFEGKQLEGIVHRINKRATVMVPDQHGAFADKKGNRYAKYYVPLSIIRKK